jgi:hypothetical protein
VSERVAALKRFHDTMSFGSRDERICRQDEAAGLYRALGPDEARELATFAIGEPAPDGERYRWHEEILLCLACLRPGSLDGLHGDLLDQGIIHPPVMWYGAGPGVASRIVGMLPGRAADLRGLDHLLLALAWIGDEAVRDAFRRWRDDPPRWADALRLPPHRYAEQAGWELTGEGTRRDLFSRRCHPLVGPEDPAADAGIARIVAEHEEACRWCGRALTTLIDLDLTSAGLSPLGLGGRRLRIASCEVCSRYGTVFTAVGPVGESSWHKANRRPDFLPRNAADWPPMAQGRLVFGKEPGPWLEAADWAVPGVRLSQVGGHPTWVQDAAYPRCPGCGRAMPFVAQISDDDLDEDSEGIYHLFACRGCGVAATNYQQS